MSVAASTIVMKASNAHSFMMYLSVLLLVLNRPGSVFVDYSVRTTTANTAEISSANENIWRELQETFPIFPDSFRTIFNSKATEIHVYILLTW